jgi:tetratricopeptide (TPR) repeat protein
MNRTLLFFAIIGVLSAALWPTGACAQAGSQRPGSGGVSGSANTGRGTGGAQPPGRPMDQLQGPFYVTGRILLETGKPSPEPVSVELNCGMRSLQVIHTDLGGYFTFSLGTGMQSNMDFSASNDNPMAQGGRGSSITGTGASSMTGCEVRVAVPGYHPLAVTLGHADMDRVEVGSLQLRRIAGVEGSAISVTSLLVPSNSRKEFERAEKELRGNHTDAAREHLQKAIAGYDKYAAAWNALGRIYSSTHNPDKAREAFQKAIAADPQYTPPYLGLATLEMENKRFQEAVDAASKLLALDSSISYASFLEAVGNFNLNRLDDAEKDARQAEKGPHENIPQVHALLAQILLQKQDYPHAASQMRVYLQESPNGQFAEQMKKDLEQIKDAPAIEAAAEAPAPADNPADKSPAAKSNDTTADH